MLSMLVTLRSPIEQPSRKLHRAPYQQGNKSNTLFHRCTWQFVPGSACANCAPVALEYSIYAKITTKHYDSEI